MAGANWQRCRVHFMRNLLSSIPKTAQDTVAAIVRTVFSQPDHASAMAQLHEVAASAAPTSSSSSLSLARVSLWAEATSVASNKTFGDVSVWGRLGLGVAQGLALQPAVSRSGITITAGCPAHYLGGGP